MDGARPRFRRSPYGTLGGVAAGLAEHLGLPVLAVRIGFLVLTYFDGFGFFLYLAYWAVVPQEQPTEPREATPATYVILGGLAALISIIGLAVVLPGRLLWPGLLVVGGLVLVWRQADVAGGRIPRRAGLVMLGTGAFLLFSGLTSIVISTVDRRRPEAGFVVTVVVLAVAAAVGWPWWRRMAVDLGRERRARIRSQERAEVAAHLHDSVLQTLTLIQRQAGSSQEVRRLARRQERELRDWLYDRSPGAPSSLAGAIRAAADEVEDGYGVVVDLVVVGDREMDERVAALVQAAREALVNAARHSGADAVSAYVEVEPEKATVYVRDRGRGFDPSTGAPGRYGLAESVVGRMQRYGGRAVVTSAPGEGTEVELELPW